MNITLLVNLPAWTQGKIARTWRGSLCQQSQIADALAFRERVARCTDRKRLAGRCHRRDLKSRLALEMRALIAYMCSSYSVTRRFGAVCWVQAPVVWHPEQHSLALHQGTR